MYDQKNFFWVGAGVVDGEEVMLEVGWWGGGH